MLRIRIKGQAVDHVAAEDLQRWTAKQGLVWLDACPAEPADVEYLSSALQLHPLVIEDIENRNQRPKVEDYGAYTFVVLFGTVRDAAGALMLAEVHIIFGDGWLATVSDSVIPAIDQIWSACDKRPEIGQTDESMLFQRICDALVDSVFPILDEMDDAIEHIEDNIVTRADAGTVADIFRLKRELSILRRVLGPERDLMQTLSGPRVPRLDAEAQIYLRDVYDHTVRIVEQIDSYRDIITGALDVYLSAVSNRLGEQTRRLTVIATIFLPLTFLTGFFGMNFGVLVKSISTPQALGVGLAAMVVSVVLVVIISQRLTARVNPVVPVETRRRLLASSSRRQAMRRAAKTPITNRT